MQRLGVDVHVMLADGAPILGDGLADAVRRLAARLQRLSALTAAGTSVWLDQIRRSLITCGELERLERDREARGMLTKSGIMVGLGETFEEVVELMKDLRAVSCDIMTIGQYLQPHARRLPVERYVTPDEFARWREVGLQLGFKHVESSPLTRSSYHAREQAAK